MEETQHKRDVSELGKPRGILQAAWPVQPKKMPEFQPLAMSFVPLTHPPPHTHINTPLSGYWPMQKTIDGSTRPCPDALSRKAFCLHLFLGQDASIVPILHPGGSAVPAVVTMATQQRGRTASSRALGTADYISLLDIPSFGPPQTPFLYLQCRFMATVSQHQQFLRALGLSFC